MHASSERSVKPEMNRYPIAQIQYYGASTSIELPKAKDFATVDGSFPSGPSNAVSHRSLQSYIWADNSCFYDTTLELMFRAFVLWPPTMRQEFMEYLGQEFRDCSVLLCTIFWHYHNRLRWILGNSRDIQPDVTFSVVHFAVQQVLRDEWKLIEANGYASAISWFPRAIEVMFPFYVHIVFSFLNGLQRMLERTRSRPTSG